MIFNENVVKEWIDWLIINENRIITIVLLSAVALFAVVFFRKNRMKNTNGLKVVVKKKNVKGLVFGMKKRNLFFVTSPAKEEGHVFCVGPSGTGKTSCLLINSLEGFAKDGGTSFTIDISGDISSNTTMDKKVVYEPENPETVAFDIFYAVDIIENISAKNIALEKIAYALVPELSPQETSAGAKFYNDGARDIVTAALIDGYFKGDEFVSICERIVSMDYRTLFDSIDRAGNKMAIRLINQFAGSIPEHIAGCKGDAAKAVKLFATNEYVKKTIHRPRKNEFCINVTSVEDYNVFLNIADAKLDVYSPLLRIIISLLLNYLSTRNMDDKNVLVCLDELASFGKLDLTEASRKLRKNRVKLYCLTQSFADCELIYGKAEFKSLLNNFKYKVILGATEVESQEYIAKMIGKKAVIKESVQYVGKSRRTTKSEAREYVFEPETLAMLGENLILMYPGGHMVLKKYYYFK